MNLAGGVQLVKLERLKKFCGQLAKEREAVFLGSGFVLTRSQVIADMLPWQSLARTQKSPPQTATEFL
jgi:hypothetical protein